MSKVLLINPPFNIAKENYDSSISVGLLSIATYLHSKGIGAEIIDGVRQMNYLDLIKEKASQAGFTFQEEFKAGPYHNGLIFKK